MEAVALTTSELNEIVAAINSGHYFVAMTAVPISESLPAQALNISELPAITKMHDNLQPLVNHHTSGQLMRFVVVDKHQVVFPVIPRHFGQGELDLGLPALGEQLKKLKAEVEARAEARHVRHSVKSTADIQTVEGKLTENGSSQDSSNAPAPPTDDFANISVPPPHVEILNAGNFRIHDKLIDALSKTKSGGIGLALPDKDGQQSVINVPNRAELQRVEEAPKKKSTQITGEAGSYDPNLQMLIVDGRTAIFGIPEEEVRRLIGTRRTYIVTKLDEPLRLPRFQFVKFAEFEQIEAAV